MLCERCFKKNATITITHIVNGQKQELNLCEDCAREAGINQAMTNLPQIFTGLMLDILKSKQNQAGLPVRHTGVMRCPFCGYSWEEFQQTGLLGCDKCYSSFYSQIKKVLREIHGNVHHIGQRPEETAAPEPSDYNLDILERALEEAIKKEEYEKAAELRDKIRTLKQKLEH